MSVAAPHRPGLLVAIAHEKGGTGKSTTACLLASWFARAAAGRQVALIDLDPQGSTTLLMNGGALPEHQGTYDLLVGARGLSAAARPAAVANLTLVPATEALTMAELDAALRVLGPEALRDPVQGAGDRFGVAFVDCPPGLGLLSSLAMAAADLVVIPTGLDRLNREALARTLAHLGRLRGDDRPEVVILPVRTEPDDASDRLALARMRRRHADLLAATVIPTDHTVLQAQEAGVPLIDYAPGAPAVSAYRKVAGEVLIRLGGHADLARRTAPPRAGRHHKAGNEATAPPTALAAPAAQRRRPLWTAALLGVAGAALTALLLLLPARLLHAWLGLG